MSQISRKNSFGEVVFPFLVRNFMSWDRNLFFWPPFCNCISDFRFFCCILVLLDYFISGPYFIAKSIRESTQRKARDIVIHNIICSSELARMCGMSYISQLGSVKNTRLAARNPILQWILTARSSNIKTYQPARKHFKRLLRQTLRFRALMTQI